jgi:hypothetical protein
MGTYTELVIKCTIKDNVPELVDNVLKFLFSEGFDKPAVLPEHEFFRSDRWESIGRSCSCYHIPAPTSFYDGKYLFSRSDLKNYDGEINLFLDWLKPYMSNPGGQLIGWIFLEQSREPIFIYNEGEWVE